MKWLDKLHCSVSLKAMDDRVLAQAVTVVPDVIVLSFCYSTFVCNLLVMHAGFCSFQQIDLNMSEYTLRYVKVRMHVS